MGVALSVFKLVNPNKKLLMKKRVTTKDQKTFADFADLNLKDKISDAKSILKFFEYDEKNERVKYNAIHYTDTIKRAVRVFIDDIEEGLCEINQELKKKSTIVLDKGYQEVYKFEVIIDFKSEEIFVFTKKSIATAFMKRFKRNGKIDYEYLHFDLTRIDELPELDNVWGVWENGQGGRCKKKAYFGTEVHKEEGIDKKKVTSYNVEYGYDSNTVDLFIANECRISSKCSLLTNADLFKIYNCLKKELSK